MTYFNEFDPHAAAWLRQLMADGLIPEGAVDERSIKDLAAVDLRGRSRAHFFAGVGGWELALQLAGWPADRPCWTGSCPCQPYSAAGKQKGNADDRDLWPDFFRLIRECRPDTVFGEQVEGAVKHGWLDRVHADLEGEGYAVGSCVLGAHSVGAPHIRQRLYWVANAIGRGRNGWTPDARRGAVERTAASGGGEIGDGLADADGAEPGGGQLRLHASGRGCDGAEGNEEQSVARGVEHPTSNGREPRRAEPNGRDADTGRAPVADGVALGDAISNGPQGQHEAGATPGAVVGANGGFWGDSCLIPCRDGKARRVPTEPLLFPLADGVPGRVGLLRGAGNAIVPQVAAAFIKAFLEAEG